MQSVSAEGVRAHHYRVPCYQVPLKSNPTEDGVSPDSVMYAVGAQGLVSARLSGVKQVDVRSPVLGRAPSSTHLNSASNTTSGKTVNFCEQVDVHVVEKYLGDAVNNPDWDQQKHLQQLDDLQKTANELRSVDSALAPSSPQAPISLTEVVGVLAKQIGPVVGFIAIAIGSYLAAQVQNKLQNR